MASLGQFNVVITTNPKQTAPSGPMLCERCSSQLSGSRLSPMAWYHNLSGENERFIRSGPAVPAKEENLAFCVENMLTKIKALIADLYKRCTSEKRFGPLLRFFQNKLTY